MRSYINKEKLSDRKTIHEEILNPSTYINKVKKNADLRKAQIEEPKEILNPSTYESTIKKSAELKKTPIIKSEPIVTESTTKNILVAKETTIKKEEHILPKKIIVAKDNSIIKNEPVTLKKIQITKTSKSNLKKEPITLKKIIIREPELTFCKAVDNPILCPKPENGWESWQTFNPAAILIDNKVHFLYRAIGDDGMSRFGYACSEDGFIICQRLSYPAYVHEMTSGPYTCVSSASGGSWGGCEDPRMVRVGDEDRIYVTYTACDGGLRVGLTSIKISDFINRRWNWAKPKIISPPGENHKNWIIFPEKINGKYAIIHSINAGILVDYLDDLEFKDGTYLKSKYVLAEVRKDRWDKKVRGVGPPPIKTKYGWLLFYHAEDRDDPGKYKVGAMILDINDPTKVLYRCKQPVLEPKEYYECEGFKGGIVYAQGAVIKDGKLIIYYGGADNFVCAAYTDFETFLEALIKGEKKKLKLKPLKKK